MYLIQGVDSVEDGDNARDRLPRQRAGLARLKNIQVSARAQDGLAEANDESDMFHRTFRRVRLVWRWLEAEVKQGKSRKRTNEKKKTGNTEEEKQKKSGIEQKIKKEKEKEMNNNTKYR